MATSKIVPHLWFTKDVVEAARFYASVLPSSSVDSVTPLPAESPSGPANAVQIVELTLCGQPFLAINGGPEFRFNPSISFMINFDPSRQKDARTKIDEVWNALSEGGKVLMPIDKYPFSERYGWIQDKHGLSWQLILTDPNGDPRPDIIPSLTFTEERCGKAEQAMEHYLSVFRHSKRGQLARQNGTIMFADFMIEDMWFAAMDSAEQHGFTFNEAVSFMINCEDQKEMDYFTQQLSAVRESEQCGWVKDRFGISWQIVPRVLQTMMKDRDRAKAKRVAEAMLGMKRLDLAALERAYNGAKPQSQKEMRP
jgi:predicted 3-demethylubiquinone-9 3-methyltransferase (glyoxalase superfamily)